MVMCPDDKRLVDIDEECLTCRCAVKIAEEATLLICKCDDVAEGE